MNIELVIGGFFIILAIMQSFLILSKLTANKDLQSNDFASLLFRFISNTSIYAATLLVFTALFQDTTFGIYNLDQFLDLVLATPIVAIMIIVILVTLLAVGIALIKGLITKEKKTTDKIIDQQQARDIR